MPRAVLDPNVLISALITPRGASATLLDALRRGAFELVTSPALIAELRAVLHRAKFRKYVRPDEIDAFVDLVRRESTSIDDPPSSNDALGEDPGDEYLIRLARAARVDALVSGDPHLTRLRSVIPAMTPREFRELLEKRDG